MNCSPAGWPVDGVLQRVEVARSYSGQEQQGAGIGDGTFELPTGGTVAVPQCCAGGINNPLTKWPSEAVVPSWPALCTGGVREKALQGCAEIVYNN